MFYVKYIFPKHQKVQCYQLYKWRANSCNNFSIPLAAYVSQLFLLITKSITGRKQSRIPQTNNVVSLPIVHTHILKSPIFAIICLLEVFVQILVPLIKGAKKQWWLKWDHDAKSYAAPYFYTAICCFLQDTSTPTQFTKSKALEILLDNGVFTIAISKC